MSQKNDVTITIPPRRLRCKKCHKLLVCKHCGDIAKPHRCRKRAASRPAL